MKYAYLDTNFYSFLRKDAILRRAVDFFRSEALVVLVTLPHWAELHKATRQHEVISQFWDDVGAVVVAPAGKTTYMALNAYPSPTKLSPDILGPISAEVISDFLAGSPMPGSVTGYSAATLNGFLEEAKPRGRDAIEEIRRIFPQVNDRTGFEDRWIFHHHILKNTVMRNHPNFTKLDFPLSPGTFPAIRLQAALVWWAHVRNVSANFSHSELGDQMHSEYFYCCDLIVLERQQHEVMRQLRQEAPNLFKQNLVTHTTGSFVRLLEKADRA